MACSASDRQAARHGYPLPCPRGVASDKGLKFEDEMGFNNLRANHEAFDHFEPDSGTAISLKATDTGLKSYQKSGALLNRLKGAIDDAANYDGTGRYADVDPSHIENRVVYSLFRTGALNDMHMAEMNSALDYAKEKGVSLLFGMTSG